MPIFFADTLSPSWDLVADIQILLHFHFMQNAYLAGTLVAITAGLMGCFMVLRNQSFAGHSLANVGFAGATGAVLFGIPPVVGLFLAGLLAAVGIQTLNLAAGERRQSDIAVGAVFTASLALGFLFIHLATAYATNVYNVLFGNVLGISDTDVGVIAISTFVLLGVLLFIARPFFFASLDPDVAAASGVPVRLLAFGYLVGAGPPLHVDGAGRGLLYALSCRLFHHDFRLWHLCHHARRTIHTPTSKATPSRTVSPLAFRR